MYEQLLEHEYEKFSFIRIPDADKHLTSFEGLQRLIMLDRYSCKDISLETLKEGDTVLTTVKYDKKYPVMGYGNVTSIEGNRVIIDIDYPDYVDGVDLGSLSRLKSEIAKPLELYWEQIAYRVAKAISDVEEEGKRDYWFKKFYTMLRDMLFIPGGRILYGAGNPANVTLFNCFVLGAVPDSRGKIIDHIKTATEIMSRGGGVGSCITTLRPRNAIVKGVNGFSSGSISWANYLAQLTHLISQAGSRRGAQMIGQHVYHPDIIEFIMCKIQNPYLLNVLSKHNNPQIAEIAERLLVRDEDGEPVSVLDIEFMTGANISVLVTDDFMDAVERDLDWELKYPDLGHMTDKEKKIYDNEWHDIVDIREWEKRGLPVKVYNTIKAMDLWDLMMICARYSAEPGIIFIDRYNKEANSYYYANIDITNPCGEQGLPKYSVCNLGAINLAYMHKDNDIDWDLLKDTVQISQRFSDNVIDASYYFLEENEKMAKMERRIGKGVMGLADLMIYLGLTYGKQDMVRKTEEIFKFIAEESYKASCILAYEKGSFPAFQCNKFLDSLFVKKFNKGVKDLILQYGIRNVTSLTVAPTGSTSTMLGVSGGIEPYFAYKYYRSGRLGQFVEVNTKIAQDYLDSTGNNELPDYFISAMELTPEEHIAVQSAAQKWVDSSISKTVNAPSDFTVKDASNLYYLAFSKGLKGITVYVDGSRDSQVLSLDKK